MAQAIDLDWRRANPLPPVDAGSDKNSRGRLLLAGGSTRVPGGLLLTALAAVRVGAGKLQMATVEPAAVPLGVAFPEAGIVALPVTDEGEIAAAAAAPLRKAAERCDTLAIGPAMGTSDDTPALLAELLGKPLDDVGLVLDAGALGCLDGLETKLRAFGGRIAMTPHHGEMVALAGIAREEVAADPAGVALATARRFGAVIALKDVETHVAAPDGTLLVYRSDVPGLGTAGSGDVLAGIVAGLMARGAEPLVAVGWGVWLHAAAGGMAAAAHGPIGLMARDLPPYLPKLLAAHAGA